MGELFFTVIGSKLIRSFSVFCTSFVIFLKICMLLYILIFTWWIIATLNCRMDVKHKTDPLIFLFSWKYVVCCYTIQYSLSKWLVPIARWMWGTKLIHCKEARMRKRFFAEMGSKLPGETLKNRFIVPVYFSTSLVIFLKICMLLYN